MEMQIQPDGEVPPEGTPRELALEGKLAKRTMLLALFVFVSIMELLVMVELVRQSH